MKRHEVYAMIDTERDYQNDLIRKNNWIDPKRVGEYLTIIRVYLQKAELAWSKEPDLGHPDERPSLSEIRKVAATAVACMETHGTLPRQ